MEKIEFNEGIIEDILKVLPQVSSSHNVNSDIYKLLNKVLINSIEKIYENTDEFKFGCFDKIKIPYISFGNINTKHLFGLDELIIFSYYYSMKDEYKTVIDLGANIGLHSTIMSKCFNKVVSFEPDDYHYSILKNVLSTNGASNAEINKMAISNTNGELEFTKVLGNTTGSHISGSKDNVYGEVEKFRVKCTRLNDVIKKYAPEFIKMDIEGQEKNVLLDTDIELLKNVDLMIEVSNEDNAKELYNHFKDTNINLFSQKNNWSKVTNLQDVPTSYKEGSLFTSSKQEMLWIK